MKRRHTASTVARLLSRPALILLIAATLLACDETPEERFAQARAAVESKDFEAFRSFFTPESKTLLRNMKRSGERSKIFYLRKPLDLFPVGEVQETFIKGDFAALKVKHRGKSVEVRMFKQDGQWNIDLMSMASLWKPLAKKE